MAIVTGGASGIGRACVHALAADGHQVVIADIDGVRSPRGDGRDGRRGVDGVDVGDEGSVADCIHSVVGRFGRVDVVVNSAARTDPGHQGRDVDVASMDIDVWRDTFATDLDGAMLMCKHAVPAMIAVGGGCVVNISSNSAEGGDLVRAAYSAAKAGINSLTRSVAVAYGRHGIRCNAVSPGGIVGPSFERNLSRATQQLIRRQSLLPYPGRPEDVAALVAFLASDRARYITGQVIAVDGGTRSQLHHVPAAREN